jgi:hypothetical protein
MTIRINVILDCVHRPRFQKKLGYHYVSEPGSVPVLRCIKLGGERLKDKGLEWNKTYTVESLRRKIPVLRSIKLGGERLKG